MAERSAIADLEAVLGGTVAAGREYAIPWLGMVRHGMGGVDEAEAMDWASETLEPVNYTPTPEGKQAQEEMVQALIAGAKGVYEHTPLQSIAETDTARQAAGSIASWWKDLPDNIKARIEMTVAATDVMDPMVGGLAGFVPAIIKKGSKVVPGGLTTQLDEVAQEFTSAATSINRNKLPAPFKKINWEDGQVNIDIGGGSFDNADEYVSQFGSRNVVYDPFNRTPEHNQAVLDQIQGNADSATVANVLNVIQEPANRRQVLVQAHDSIKPGGKAYISVYEGDRKGVGRQSQKDSWQENRSTKAYLEEVREVFPDAKIQNGMIVGTKAKDRDTYLVPTDKPNTYTMGASNREEITPLNIQMQNPLVADLDRGKRRYEQWELDLADAFDERTIDKKALMAEGHDGVVVKRPGGNWDYMTVSPGQINDRATDQLLQDALDFKGEGLGIKDKWKWVDPEGVKGEGGNPNVSKDRFDDPLWHPIGINKLTVPYDKMTSVSYRDPTMPMQDLENIMAEEMIGEWNLSSPWDRSVAGRVVTHVNGKPLARPVQTEGGRGHIQRTDQGVLGSGEDVVSGYEKRARSAPEGSVVNVTPTVMSSTSSDFSTMVSEVHVNRLHSYDVSDDAKALFDKEMIEGTGNKEGKNRPQPKWPGLDNPDLVDHLKKPGMGGVRGRFLDLMERAHHKDAGFPDVPSSRKAIEDETLRDIPTGWSGGTIGEWDLTQALMKSSHGSYPFDAPGRAKGTLGKDLPLSVMQADAIARRRMIGKAEGDDLKSVEYSKPIQEITPELAQIMDVHPGFRMPGGRQ